MVRLKRQRIDELGVDRVTSHDSGEIHGSNKDASSRSKHSGEQKGRSLFVRSLPTSVTSESLANYFSQSYPIKHATVVFDKAKKQSKGFGFVTFADPEDATVAQRALNGAEFDGRHICVDVAQPRNRGKDPEHSLIPIPAFKKTHQHNDKHLYKLIVRNIPWTIKREDQLASLFTSFGKVQHVNLPKRKPGCSPGFGFIVFRQHEVAKKALDSMNGKEVDGRMLAVDWAVDKNLWETLQQSTDENERMGSGDGRNDIFDIETSDTSSSASAKIFHEAGEKETTIGDIPETTQDADDQQAVQTSSVEDHVSTVFVCNIPFTATNDLLYQHFTGFGPLRSAIVVKDSNTGQSKGTGFVRFKDATVANDCLHEAKQLYPSSISYHSGRTTSILEDNTIDPTGRFTLEGRVLKVFRAVDRAEAARLSVTNAQSQSAKGEDKRRLYLLAEGSVAPSSLLYKGLSSSEVKLREDSMKQRQAIVSKDPSLHLSLTRLSIRNLPKDFTSKALKALAREAVLGFATDVRTGLRKPLSREEIVRGGEEMRLAEKTRKAKGKGIVKQAKIIFEGRDGAKVAESSGAGRSRGYGFVEYTSHRWALMGLRWLNGHLLEVRSNVPSSETPSFPTTKKTRRRLIVEFAIDNAQVVARRQHREIKTLNKFKDIGPTREAAHVNGGLGKGKPEKNMAGREGTPKSFVKDTEEVRRKPGSQQISKEAKKQRIIGRKRMARKLRNKK